MASWVTLLLALAGCTRDAPPEDGAPLEQAADEAYVETGDLPALRERGRLRILAPRPEETYLPREGFPLDVEREIAAAFARAHDLVPVMVYIDDFSQLLPALLAGRGDVAAANITVTDARRESVAFTVPLDQSRETVVTRADDSALRTLEDLAGRTLAVRPATTFWETAQGLKARVPTLRVQAIDNSLGIDATLDRVARGEIDLTLADSNVLDVALDYREDVRAALPVTGERSLAWAVRPDNPQLLAELNRFLSREQLTRPRRSVHTDDLPGIKQRRTLRVITINGAATYFLWQAELMGFEYELAREFAGRQGLRLEVVVAPTHEAMLPMLRAGKGDLVAAFLARPVDAPDAGIAYSRPYHYATEVVVGRAGVADLPDAQALAGRRVAARPSSHHWQTLQRLRAQGIAVEPVAADEALTGEDMIAAVAEGSFDLAVVDSHILDMELTWRDDVRGLLALGEPRAHAWAVRAENPKLLEAVNAFLRKEYRGVFYNVVYEKYFESPHLIARHRDERIDLNPDGRLSPYDATVKQYADRYDIDWRLIVAQIYQESRFDPQARSWAGARGLMQVLPRTARELGFQDLHEPETGIHAGVAYLAWLRERFEPELDPRDRMLFAVAAYNAGLGHVRDARRLARQQGWNQDRWFGHVERAMLLLAQPKYASQARHGYARGSETVEYVRQIHARYTAYVTATERRGAAPATGPAGARASSG